MRVISGKAKGSKLKCLDTIDIRPTTDRVKESLFNILVPYIMNSHVLDLFAGTGGLGIEAISRGARGVVFIEQSIQAGNIIKENLGHTKLTEYATLGRQDAYEYLLKTDDKFDIILLDPPYKKNMIKPALKIISERNLLLDNGIIVAECEQNEQLPERIENLRKSDIRIYGRIILNFYKKTID